MSANRSYVRELDTLTALYRSGGVFDRAVVQGLDLRDAVIDWGAVSCQGTVFLGCRFPVGVTPEDLMSRGATVFPGFPELPYDPYRARLYSRAELMEGWTPEHDGSVDKRIYDHFVGMGRDAPGVLEALAQRLHDHAVDDALRDLLEGRTDGAGMKRVVGVMGGHGTARTDPFYRKVVRAAQELTREGYFVTTGGGPGIMEAANLGAYLADVTPEELEEVLAILGRAPCFSDEGYVEAAREVVQRFRHGHPSLAVPTWFYGHEPSNLFSVHIAKYFSNSLREDGLLAIATHGILFAPGSAGTTQEVFQDATQNHYGTYELISPMVFLGREHFGEKTGIFDCLGRQAAGKTYGEMLFLTDDEGEAVAFFGTHPPKSG